MLKLICTLLIDDRGQDLVEYSLLLAFVLFTVAGLAQGFGASIAGITSLSNAQIDAAAVAAS
jgi:Flp pilus assembly pilin Flp